MGKEKFVSIRLSEEDKRLLEKDAEKEQRNISNLLLWCWRRWRKSRKRK